MITCWFYRKRIYYAQEGWLPERQAEGVANHLARCSRCRYWREQARTITDAAAQEQARAVDRIDWDSFARGITAGIDTPSGLDRPSAYRVGMRMRYPRRLAAFACVIIGLIVFSAALPIWRQSGLPRVTEADLEQAGIALNESFDLGVNSDEDIVEEAALLMSLGYFLNETV